MLDIDVNWFWIMLSTTNQIWISAFKDNLVCQNKVIYVCERKGKRGEEKEIVRKNKKTIQMEIHG